MLFLGVWRGTDRSLWEQAVGDAVGLTGLRELLLQWLLLGVLPLFLFCMLLRSLPALESSAAPGMPPSAGAGPSHAEILTVFRLCVSFLFSITLWGSDLIAFSVRSTQTCVSWQVPSHTATENR